MLLPKATLWYNVIMYYEGKYRKQREKKEQKARDRRLFALALIPLVIFIALGAKILQLEKELAEVNASLAKIQYALKNVEEAQGRPEPGDIVTTPLPDSGVPQPEQQTSAPVEQTESPEKKPTLEETWTGRKVYLTFDDGPSIYTTKILDILDDYNVKATFFVLGKDDPQSIELMQDIYERGHTIGRHSYSHKYTEMYASEDAFAQDYQKLYTFLKEKVGVESFCYRFPGGSSNTISKIDMKEFAAYLEEQGVKFHDWNISSGDGAPVALTTEQIKENVLKDLEKYNSAVVLMHDSAEKGSTVDALPEIIEAILELEDTIILPISENTVPIQHIQG